MFSYSKAQVVGILISFLIIFAVSITLHFALKNKSEKIRKVPQQVITIFLILSELVKLVSCLITKQFFELYPFYFCSYFWIWFLLGDFLPKGKIKNSCEAISFVGSFAVTILFLMNPSSILGPSLEVFLFESYLNFHHILFHSLVCFHLFLCIFLGTYKTEKSHFLYVLIWVAVLCLIIVPGAYLTGTNYMNILSSKISFLENVRLQYGQFVYDFFLILWLTIALELSISVFYLIYKKFEKEKPITDFENTNVEKKFNMK